MVDIVLAAKTLRFVKYIICQKMKKNNTIYEDVILKNLLFVFLYNFFNK